MFPRLFAALAVVCATLLAAPAAANAEDYVPGAPEDPTLAGSTVSPACEADVPWIQFRVVLTDPESLSTSRDATLVLSDGSNTHTVPLGTIGPSGVLEGRVLWPGASVGPDGRGDGWPGWAFVGGEWVETDGNFAWTRGSIDARIEVNPSIPVALSYPPATPQCLTDPPRESTPAGTTATGIASTGFDGPMWAGVGIGAAGLIALGVIGVVLARRRRVRE
ncbi:cell wall protein [Agromyces larvae]|uniref:Cell wall protein n=1 Tax=Agromyces larvae TaxID=2929802 RepID=A0ABY4BX80_9MICO|nr:cell wall protein [Agromyces larvae]UOE43800.1 cell wall protein [Agromyces larvae]